MEDGWPFRVRLDDEWAQRCSEVAATLLEQDDQAFFVIDADDAATSNKLAACISVAVQQHLPGPTGSGHAGYIGDMCTDPAYRGRGYGSSLLRHAMDWAAQQGAWGVSLWSTESGRPIYVKAGFESGGGPFEHMSVVLD